jgi:hypothetical protein
VFSMWTGPAARARTLLGVFVVSLGFASAGPACTMGSAAQPSEPPGQGSGGSPGSIPSGPGKPKTSTGYDPQINNYAPDSPYTYVAKVKNILVGLPPTDSEIQSVVNDPTAKTTANALKALIQTWMTTVDPNSPTSPMYPQGMTYYQEKMMVFFKLAFQQTQVAAIDFGNQFNPGALQPFSNKAANGPLLLQNAQESFARTALQLPTGCVNATLGLGQLCGFQQSMTTQTFAMTTALKVLYALTDVWQLNDQTSGVVDTFATNPNIVNVPLYFSGVTQYKLTNTLTPKNADFMHWYIPGLSCPTDPLKIPYSKTEYANILYDALTGNFDAKHFPGCTGGAPLITPAMYSDWTMVTISQPTGTETTTNFYDLENLPTATSMVLNRPFVSFFTTPAFFANWQTNSSNTMRVTTNQALIVGLGQYINYTDPTASMKGFPSSPPGLDQVHADGVCRGCHQFLDPTRSIFAKSYSWNYGYGLQDEYMETNPPSKNDPFNKQNGEFLFQGVMATPTTINDFGSILGTHPLLPTAWVQKLSYYVNSQPDYVSGSIPNDTAATDPELLRVVKAFKDSNYSWDTLVLELLSSPLTTNAAPTSTTATAQEGVTIAVSRRDHLCAALNFRLGFTDICGLNASTVIPKGKQGTLFRTIATIAGGLPSDGYGRGSNVPVLPTEPSLFYRSGLDNLCWTVAQLVVDPTTTTNGVQYFYSSSSQLSTSLAALVTNIMGVTVSNPLYKNALAALTDEYNAAIATPVSATPTEALESVFTTACLSPSFSGVGMQ